MEKADVGSRTRRRAHRGPFGEKGAALVEAAIVLPLVIILVLGLIECGLMFRDYLTLANMTRSGARVSSAAGSDAFADYETLASATGSGSAVNLSSIGTIIVFKAQDASGPLSKVPTDCLTASQLGRCNRYTAADLTKPKTSFGCTDTCVDRFYSPTTRKDSQSGAGPDRVGIYITLNHRLISGVMGSGTMKLADTSVMRIEPKQR